MAEEARIACMSGECPEVLVRPEEGSSFSTPDLARLAGWREVAMTVQSFLGPVAVRRWMCPPHASED